MGGNLYVWGVSSGTEGFKMKPIILEGEKLESRREEENLVIRRRDGSNRVKTT